MRSSRVSISSWAKPKWLTRAACVVALVLASTAAVSVANAEPLQHALVVTFGKPVALPDHVVQPGTYEFTLIAPDVVRVTTDNGHLVGSYMAVSTDRVVPERSELTLEERAANAPMAVSEWYFEGDNLGVKLIYK